MESTSISAEGRVEVKKKSHWTIYQTSIVALLTLGMIINFVDRVNLSVVIPVLIKEYHLKASEAGILLSVLSWFMVVAMLWSGPVIDRFHPKRVLPAALSFWSLATVMACLSPGLLFLGFTRFLVSLGEACLPPSTTKLVSELFEKDDQGKAIGTYFAGSKAGITIGTPLAAVILAAYGWRAVFIVTGSLGLLWLIPWFLIYRSNKEVILLPNTATGAASPGKIKYASLFKDRKVWALMLGNGAYLYVYFVFVTWLPGYLVLERHMSILKTGFYSMIPFLIAVFVNIFSGWLSDLWIRAGGKLSVVRKTFIGGGFGLSTILILLSCNIEAKGLSLFFLFMSMGVLGMVSSNINVLPIDMAPRSIVSSVTGLFMAGGWFGAALAPVLTGVIYGRTGSFHMALLLAGGVAVIGLLVNVFVLGKVELSIGTKKLAISSLGNASVSSIQ